MIHRFFLKKKKTKRPDLMVLYFTCHKKQYN